ncbi:hypothetical protein [Allobaculum sp. JKK-2023]|uniref:hypothetical protein n=1 Tax=Allobaculum sp. JKK-2023 TaxID=3108943 RepID=UPI002B05E236|nr:hypothetical protein [Allobaculum sp. JKK-2023]
MSFLKQIREFLDQFNVDLEKKARANEILKEIQEEGFIRGVECTGENVIKSLEPGTVQTVNVSPNQIEIFMDEGNGYLIENNLMPLAAKVKVKPDDEVAADQVLIELDNADSIGLEVFAFTSDMLAKLSEIRERLELGLPYAVGE